MQFSTTCEIHVCVWWWTCWFIPRVVRRNARTMITPSNRAWTASYWFQKEGYYLSPKIRKLSWIIPCHSCITKSRQIGTNILQQKVFQFKRLLLCAENYWSTAGVKRKPRSIVIDAPAYFSLPFQWWCSMGNCKCCVFSETPCIGICFHYPQRLHFLAR
jgi:hypothetical protein